MKWQPVSHQYEKGSLNDSLKGSPFKLIQEWVKDAVLEGLRDPNSAFLATADSLSVPDGRVVLIKQIQKTGLVFFTNYESKKAQDLAANPNAALVFFWPSLERVIRVRGSVKKTSRKISEKYFHSRSRGSQISAWSSKQSMAIASRQELEKEYHQVEKRFDGKPIPCPENWGGYRLIPTQIEFWQGRRDRLHDRLLFEEEKGHWKVTRLSP